MSLWFICLLLYFKLANKYKIVDKPNERSSHQEITIRGGGIIFPISILLGISYESMAEIITALSLFVIALLSFIDDIKNIDSRVRLIIQCIAVIGLLFSFYDFFPLQILLLLFICITGVINAYNFMDGINGITVLYSLVTLISLYYIHYFDTVFMSDELFISLFCALLVFGFFNIRKKARCFSGDVGSVTLAFGFCYLILKLSISTGFVWWILFLGVYGIDTLFTIICRVLRKEPLMQAHRSHFYQYLVNEAGWGHIQVSLLYALAQLLLNLIVIYSYQNHTFLPSLLTLIGFLVIYSIFRLRFEGSKRLFNSYNPF